jgi:phage gp29-like protein
MTHSRFVLTIVALVALTGTDVHAQQTQQTPPNPEQLKQVMQATMGAMVSVMGPMTEAVIDAQLNSAAKPETAEKIATFKRNLYEALLKKGFNGIDAMQIVISTSMPSAAPATK